MKGEDLFNALGEIDDSLIDKTVHEKTENRKSILKWAVGIAACLCLLLTGSYAKDVLILNTYKLAPIDISSIVFEPMGMGYEGTDDLSLKNSEDINPWTKDADIEELPVYKNLRYNDGRLPQSYYSADDLKKQVEDFAEELKLDIISGEVIAYDENEISGYTLKTKQGRVITHGKGINFVIKNGYEYLLQEHQLLSYGSTEEKISGVYRVYSVDSELLDENKRSYFKSGNIVDDIVAFNLLSHYECKAESYTSSRSDDFLLASESLGNYPVITWKQAQKKLLDGEYVTSADESQVIGGELTKDAIADVDLIYYTDGNPEFYVPYYRFYVKYYSADSDNQRYAYFYVCAIYDKYLKSYETFDESYQ